MSTDSKELVERQQAGALMVATFEEELGQGFEEAGASAYAIPFLKILQSGSKQLKRANAEYIEGAREGDFFNTVTCEVFDGDKGLPFIPAHFIEKYLEWEGTVDEGGGLAGMHSVAEGMKLLLHCTRDDDGYDRLENKHILQNIREHYGCFVHPVTGELVPVVVSLSSTQIKKSKKWMSQMGALKRNPLQAKPDAQFSHAYLLTTVPEKKDTFDYFGINIKHLGGLETDIECIPDPTFAYEQTKNFRAMVLSGQAQLAEPGDEIPF